MYCPNCGTETSANFCPNCGQALNSNFTQIHNSTPNYNTQNYNGNTAFMKGDR